MKPDIMTAISNNDLHHLSTTLYSNLSLLFLPNVLLFAQLKTYTEFISFKVDFDKKMHLIAQAI